MDKTNTLYNESAVSNKDDKKIFSKLGIGFFVFALISLASQLILSNIAKKYFSFITESDFYSVGLIIVSFYSVFVFKENQIRKDRKNGCRLFRGY